MKYAKFLMASAILGFGYGSFSLPVRAETEAMVNPQPLSPSASIGPLEVSPESRAALQPTLQPSLAIITLPAAPSPGLFERLFSGLSLPSSGSTNLAPGQFDPPINRGVGLINANI
jgi:hypothetical protein